MNTTTISNGARSHEEELRDRLYFAIRRDGGDPSSFLDLLSTAVEEKTWKRLGLPFRAFVEEPSPNGLGLSPETLVKVLEFPHKHEEKNQKTKARMASMRAEVHRLLKGEIGSLAELGEIGRGRGRVGVTNSIQANTADYVVARLKRDDPTLAEQVVNGELTANAAARQAGIRRPRIVLSTPERIAASLCKHLDPAALARLIELLKGRP